MGLSIGPTCRVNDQECNTKLMLTVEAWYYIPNQPPAVGPGMTYLAGQTTVPPLAERFGGRFELRPMGLSIGPTCLVNDQAGNTKLILTG